MEDMGSLFLKGAQMIRIAKIKEWAKWIFLCLCHNPALFPHDQIFVAHNSNRRLSLQGHGLWGWPASSAMLRI